MEQQIPTVPQTAATNNTDEIFIIGQQNLHSNILTSVIGNTFGISCDIYTEQELLSSHSDPKSKALVLIDCSCTSPRSATNILRALQTTNMNAAVINADANSQYETLTEWPRLNGFFYADCSHDHLLQGIETLLNDGHWLPRALLEVFLRHRQVPEQQRSSDRLTVREQEILSHLVKGDTNLDIATALFVSEYTVKSHLYNIFKKIDAKNRLQACNWAKQNLVLATAC